MSYQQQRHQDRQQRPRFQPPSPYSISRGIVSRIEPYGCFVKLDSSPISGLVHISQLHFNKIEDVNDVVSLEDEVWVKVMDVQVEEVEDPETGRMRQRHKVKLSMKYVHQDTGQDLDPDNEQLEADMQRGSKSGGGGGGRNGNNFNNTGDGTNGANSQLGRALASNIGMSSAIDPGNLILKGKSSGSDAAAYSSTFNGYALVGEDEGEPEPTLRETTKPRMEQRPAPVVVKPMGRGRGTTLPAWMTRSDSPADRLGSMDKKETMRDEEKNNNHNDRKQDKKHGKEKHRSSKRSRHSDDRKHRKKHKHKKSNKDSSRRRGHSRSQSYSSHSASLSIASRSRSRSPSRSLSSERRHRPRSKSHRKRKKSHKHHHHHHRHGNSRSRRSGDYSDNSRSNSRSRSRSHGRDGNNHNGVLPSSSQQSPSEFSNVEEARAILERLERRQREG